MVRELPHYKKITENYHHYYHLWAIENSNEWKEYKKVESIYRYKSVAIFVASDIFLQSISQKRAETVVVNETQSLTKVNGVDPVTSSH